MEKQARKWKDLTLDEQRSYLRRHPMSKRRLTSHHSNEKVLNFEEMKGSKRVVKNIKRLIPAAHIVGKV